MNQPNNATAVYVANFGDMPKAPKPVYADKTTLKTYALSTTAPAGNTPWVQISDYEPHRVRMVIQVYDKDVAILTQPPRVTPDADAVGTAPEGRLLQANPAVEYIFYGKDAFYINPLDVAGSRVTVMKEYC